MRSLFSISPVVALLWVFSPINDATDPITYTQLTGSEIVLRSIQHHDPQGKWLQQGHELVLKETRSDGSARRTELILDPGAGKFSLAQQRGDDHISRFFAPDNCVITLNGESTFSAEQAEKYRLSCEESIVYRDYYTYLWGLPMKLQDTGTQIDPKVESVDFFGQQLLQVRVTYTAEVGEDSWYFYFHPITYALSGYRFYHDEAANDGEYILLEAEAVVGPLLLPSKRRWYTHQDDEYLGMDEIVE